MFEKYNIIKIYYKYSIFLSCSAGESMPLICDTVKSRCIFEMTTRTTSFCGSFSIFSESGVLLDTEFLFLG